MGAEASSAGTPEDDSVTDVGDPALIRAPSIEIERGAVLAGRYQVEAIIGKGGSGVVLRAFDRVAETPVAIKILRSDLASDPRWVERFSRELRLGRQIQHPNVCRVFDIGEADGHRFLTMELATQGTLRDAIEASGRPLADRLADVRAVVSGLAAIHAAGIVHRDVKPENLLRMADGRLVLSDFGLATNPGDAPAVTIMVGTPSYMAPEIVMGAPATTRSDVWALGVVAHEVLFGGRPARAAGKKQNAPAAAAPSSRLERSLAQVCEDCTAADPDRRPADAAAFSRIMEGAIARPVRALLGRTQRRMRRASGWGLVLVGVVTALWLARHRMWQAATAGQLRTGSPVARVTLAGQPADWSRDAAVLATLDGQLHCVMPLPGGKAARLVWGSPRRAEDLDLATGTRTPSRLRPETYAVDCPQASPDGEKLLFTKALGAEAAQIMFAGADGADARPLVNGTEPLWMPAGEEFLFNLDSSHVAVYSLPTRSFSVLSESDGDDVKRHLSHKTLNQRGNLEATVYDADGLDHLVVIRSLPALALLGRWRLPRSATSVHFDGDRLMFSDQADPPALAELDWKTGTARRLGFVPGATIRSLASAVGGGHLFVARETRSDVWTFDTPASPRRLTHDGTSFGASACSNGDVLVHRRIDGNRYVISRYAAAGGDPIQLTNGPLDGAPSCAPDGARWLYTDYARKVIRTCDGTSCRDLRRDDLLPVFASMAPEGQRLAFVTLLGTPHLHVIGDDGAGERDLGPTAIECPPIWADKSKLWGFSGTGNDRAWVEIDLATGRKTGSRKAAAGFDLDKGSCGWESEAPRSPFFQRARAIADETYRVYRSRALAGL